MDHLDGLEAQSIILREAFARLKKLALLWSLGKDSNVMIWLARKAFFGRVPFRRARRYRQEISEILRVRDRYGKENSISRSSPARRRRIDPTCRRRTFRGAQDRGAEMGADQIRLRRADRRHQAR
jgi:3'-phosphoadenosine 5'-phosphosulfate sulfotransferase (PAPS reductase)/FAD synthetase